MSATNESDKEAGGVRANSKTLFSFITELVQHSFRICVDE